MTKTSKPKKGFMDVYSRTYDTSNGFGNASQWRKAFNKRMNVEEANVIVGTKSPYSILGLLENATWEEIKKAFRKLALKYHPDICKDIDAEDRMKELNACYTILEKKFND